jgi:hypothetical protein
MPEEPIFSRIQLAGSMPESESKILTESSSLFLNSVFDISNYGALTLNQAVGILSFFGCGRGAFCESGHL